MSDWILILIAVILIIAFLMGMYWFINWFGKDLGWSEDR